MNHVTMYIYGASCLDCIRLIEKEMIDLGGIFSFKGLMPKGKLFIKYNPSIINISKIVDKIEKIGFSVVKIIQKEERMVMFD